MNNRKWMWSFVSFLAILNGLFIGLELYKMNIRNQWSSQQLLPEEAFLQLDRINSWTVVIEATLSISILLIAVWLILRKNSFLKNFIIGCAWTQVVFLIIGWLLATYFEIAVINLVTQLLGPIFILAVIALYLLVKHFLVRQLSYRKINQDTL